MKLGNSDITLKLGSADVNSIYLGTTLVYSGGSTPQPCQPMYDEYSTQQCNGCELWQGVMHTVSYDCGETWQDDWFEETDLLDSDSQECGCGGGGDCDGTPQYSSYGAYQCDGCDLYQGEMHTVSYDCGETWQDDYFEPLELLEENSSECGCGDEPPEEEIEEPMEE